MIPSVRATWAITLQARSRSERLWVAVTMARRRALPSGTVGKHTAGAKTPASKRSRENAKALAASPTWMGVMGVWLAPVEKPSLRRRFWKNFVLDQSFLMRRSPSGESSRVNAAWQAAVTAGGGPGEKRNGRAGG